MRGFKPLMLALSALLFIGVVTAADAPSARWNTKFENLTLPAGFEAMSVLVDFPPGSVFPMHSHGGPVIVLVIEGEITLVENGATKVYKAGQGFNEQIGQVHEAQNRGTTKASVVATYLLPKGAQPDIFVKK